MEGNEGKIGAAGGGSEWADLQAARDAVEGAGAIVEATATMLAPQAFDEFCAMLDAPMPQAAADLLSRKAAWE